jgi:hypothetical protein
MLLLIAIHSNYMNSNHWSILRFDEIDPALPPTARQYGEVVLPDTASGNCPGTPRERSHETVPVEGGYGAFFAVRVPILLSITRVAVQVSSEPENCQVTGFLLEALAQCGGTNCLGARKLSRCRIYIACR